MTILFVLGLNIGDVVSVYADIVGTYKKGLLKPFEIDSENKIFLGNGILKQTRKNIFCNDGQIARYNENYFIYSI